MELCLWIFKLDICNLHYSSFSFFRFAISSPLSSFELIIFKSPFVTKMGRITAYHIGILSTILLTKAAGFAYHFHPFQIQVISTDDDNQFNVRSVIIMTTTGDQFKVSFQDSWYEHVAPWPGTVIYF